VYYDPAGAGSENSTPERKLIKSHIVLSIKPLLSLVIRSVFY